MQYPTNSFFNYEIEGMTPEELKVEQNMFDMIKNWCSGRPNLVKKLVHWGISKDQEPSIPIKISPARVKKLANGRLWVSCMLSTSSTKYPGEGTSAQESVDNLKGAYQEVEKGSGIYVQPTPEVNQSELQHRLKKVNDFWIIEERDPLTKCWKLRIQEKPGLWLDMKYVYQTLKVKVIPMAKILERMTDSIFDGDVEKKLDFLFEECSQKKLNTKLRKRNLDHNIKNLKVKLEKQRCLSFAVKIVKVADAIAQEHGIFC